MLARRYLPKARSSQQRARHDLDPVGVVLLGLTVLFLIFPFIEQQQWHSVWRLVMFPVAAILLAIFLGWDWRYLRRGREPEVDLRLFKLATYRNWSLLGMVYFAGFTGIFFIFSISVQEGLGYSALMSGVATLPFAIGSAISAAVSGKFVVRIGRLLVVLGTAVVLVGVLGLVAAAHLVPGTNFGFAAAAPLFVAGIGGGMVITPNITLTVSEVPVSQAGAAGGVLQTGQRVGSAAGIAITGSVFLGVLNSAHGKPDFLPGLRHGQCSHTGMPRS